jgi:hypothetical protein
VNTYVCSRTIGGLWANNQADNVWVWINGLSWRKLDSPNTTSLLIVAARAKASGTVIDFVEEERGGRRYIKQIIPTGWVASDSDVSRGVSECIYGWTAAYSQRGPNILVRIQLNKDANVTQAELDAAKTRWSAGIFAKWSYHFACCDDPNATSSGNCPHPCTLVLGVEWVTSNAHHVVSVHRGPGRADMLNWYHDDSGNDMAHEFGHMLGNKDEYPDSNCPARSPVNTGTVMDMVSGPVVRRLVDFLCTDIGQSTVPL